MRKVGDNRVNGGASIDRSIEGARPSFQQTSLCVAVQDVAAKCCCLCTIKVTPFIEKPASLLRRLPYLERHISPPATVAKACSDFEYVPYRFPGTIQSTSVLSNLGSTTELTNCL